MAFFNDLKIPPTGKQTGGFLTINNEGKLETTDIDKNTITDMKNNISQINDTIGTIDTKLDQIIGE